MIQRYAIKPVLKHDDHGTAYAAFEYVPLESGMCVFFGDHDSTVKGLREEIAMLRKALGPNHELNCESKQARAALAEVQ